MPDSDPIDDVEIEIDLGLGLEEEEKSASTQAAPSKAPPEKPIESKEENEPSVDSKAAEPEPAAEPQSLEDDIAASLAEAIGELTDSEPTNEEVSDKQEQPEQSPEATQAKDEDSKPAAVLELPEIDTSDASELDFRKVGIATWKVKVKIGLVYDFSDIKTLRKYISDGRVTNEDVISHNGKDWSALGDIPDLDAHFIDVYRHALAANPELLKATPSTETPESLSEEAESLTNSILDQINQEVEASSPSPAEGVVGPEFSDPFQALKKAQKGRGSQRKKMAKARAKHNKEMAKQGRLGLVLLGLLGAILFVLNPFKGESNSTETENASNESEPNETELEALAKAEAQAELEAEMQEEMAKKLEVAQAQIREQEEAENPEEQRRVVRPPEAIRLMEENPGAAGSGLRNQRPMTPVQRGKKAYRERNFQEAVSAYKEAVEQAGGSPSPQIHLGYGKALFQTGSYGPAMRHLIRADRGGAADREAYRFLIELHRQRGDDAGANTYSQKLAQLR